MVISTCTEESLPAFYECFLVLMEEGYGQFSKPLVSYFLKYIYSYQNFYLWHTKNFRKIMIAKEGEDIIGFLVGDNSYGGVGFISWLGIVKEHRRKGIGSELLKKYEEYIKTKKAHVLELYTKKGLLKFYQKLGFTEVGRRPEGFFGQKNIIMNKKIGSWTDNNLPSAEATNF